MLLHDRRYRRAHRIHARHPVDPLEEATRSIDGQDRRGLGTIFMHPRAYRLLIVVGPPLELV